jgi:hypothetical protein
MATAKTSDKQMSKSLQQIADDLISGNDPNQLALEVGIDRVNEAIDILEDRI